MTNLTTHPENKPQHIRDNLDSLFFKIPEKRHTQKPSPTFLIREVLTVSKKKHTERKREREGEGGTSKNEAPTPPGTIKKQSSPENRGRKGRNPAVEDQRID